ncbi:hypothetical protein A1122_03465 [Yersinia pestis A1122]|nr:hypothetical protein A1122_03465 [Yersinia pestis A1122]EKS48097.1 hypothetical protein INS_01700 [Yersinia pestis INS]QOW12621.1 hypothetical protein S96127_0314 [Yersinia pestis]
MAFWWQIDGFYGINGSQSAKIALPLLIPVT